MATVASIIDSARYDLRDYQEGIIWDDTELLEYLNRMVNLLDSTLASLNSDIVMARDNTNHALADGDTTEDVSSLNSGNWDSIDMIWISTDPLTKIPLTDMWVKRLYDLNDGQPRYWALQGDTIYFEKTADTAYTLDIYYNKKTATLTATDNMPYSDIYNGLIREMLVKVAKSKYDQRMSQPVNFYEEMFFRRVMQEEARRSWMPPTYHKDF